MKDTQGWTSFEAIYVAAYDEHPHNLFKVILEMFFAFSCFYFFFPSLI